MTGNPAILLPISRGQVRGSLRVGGFPSRTHRWFESGMNIVPGTVQLRRIVILRDKVAIEMQEPGPRVMGIVLLRFGSVNNKRHGLSRFREKTLASDHSCAACRFHPSLNQDVSPMMREMCVALACVLRFAIERYIHRGDRPVMLANKVSPRPL